MNTELDCLLSTGPRPRPLREVVWPQPLAVAVVAPHPDDFDAIALSLRHLHRQGHSLQVAVLTTGASGVDDGFAGAADQRAKAALREAEQRESCAAFGLAPQALAFLRLWEGGMQAAAQAGDGLSPLRQWLRTHPADLLFMPHGNDSNATHRRTCETVRALAAELGLAAWACLNQDAKTAQMRVDLYFDFDEEEAAWKAALLRLHRSQQERNLRMRGTGLDARVLAVNRAAADALGTARAYAEVFELIRLGSSG